MKIRDLFIKDIFRPINGVIKAEQQDQASIWQELDELVLTKELTGNRMYKKAKVKFFS